MRRLFILLAMAALTAAACGGGSTTTGGATPSPRTDPLSTWKGLQAIAEKFKLTDKQQADLADEIAADESGDQFYVSGSKLTPKPETDIARTVAFQADLSQEAVDQLFNKSEFPCSTADQLGGYGAGGFSTWCPRGNPVMPAELTNIYCAETSATFVTKVDVPELRSEYGFVIRLDGNENYTSTLEGDFFNGGAIAGGARYSRAGPETFTLKYDGRSFKSVDLSYRVIYQQSEETSTFCGVVPADDVSGGAPFRIFTFYGTRAEGSADAAPSVKDFTPTIGLKLTPSF